MIKVTVMKKIAWVLLSLPLLFISWLLIDQYALRPAIQFPISKTFSGSSIYNPYQHMDTSDVALANLHAHAKAWNGLTNGRGDGNDIWNRYDSLGYTFHAVSQYLNIDTHHQSSRNYIPVYEHGINLQKTHQLVIGATSVEWKDYFFPQTIYNKQFVINKIAEDPNVLIVLNHPGMLNGYSTTDFEQLYNYDLIEVLNPQAQSFPQWDAALSTGHPVFGLADDDVHNVFDNKLLGRFYNVVYTTNGNRFGLLTSLKEGNFLTVSLPEDSRSLLEKRKQIDAVKSIVQSVSVEDEGVNVQFSVIADTVKLVGQAGKLIKKQLHAKAISYHFLPTDTYVRLEVIFKEGTKLYMNPFFRY